eukprot:m.2791 g.2791  ORF g.2791 m.2791 type:complete len:169 (-) comp4092_c0_seq1:779-1285(-)
MAEASVLLLKRQLKELTKEPVQGFSAGLKDDNIYLWEVVMMPPDETLYAGAIFKAELEFSKEYPSMPPTMKFVKVVPWHPNVYDNGNVCISILHPPGDDEFGYEDSGERWLPVHTVTTILLSVLSMISDPNDESPANVEAAKQWRDDRAGFQKRVRQCVRQSQELAFE